MAIVGLGYAGLPLAQGASSVIGRVIGLDVNDSVVSALRAGRSHVDDLDDVDVAAMLDRGFEPSTDEAVLKEATAFIICVPTPLSIGDLPNLDALTSACAMIGRHLKRGDLVVLESTTFAGTTEEMALPILERVSGLRGGADFALAYSPERIDPGNATFGIANTPKIVGGMTAACTARAVAFYQRFIAEVVEARGTREAEMAKLLENTYRQVNIALVNELAQFCHAMQIDIWDVIRCASTKPFGFKAFHPGPGVGGHCIPIDPSYLSYSIKARLGQSFRLVDLAHEINSAMPDYVARRIQDLLNERGIALRGARVLLIGITYKADIADQREAPANDVARWLRDHAAILAYHDPYVAEWNLDGQPVVWAPDLAAAASAADVVVVLQHHTAVDLDVVVRSGSPVLDTRGKLVGEQVTLL